MGLDLVDKAGVTRGKGERSEHIPNMCPKVMIGGIREGGSRIIKEALQAPYCDGRIRHKSNGMGVRQANTTEDVKGSKKLRTRDSLFRAREGDCKGPMALQGGGEGSNANAAASEERIILVASGSIKVIDVGGP